MPHNKRKRQNSGFILHGLDYDGLVEDVTNRVLQEIDRRVPIGFSVGADLSDSEHPNISEDGGAEREVIDISLNDEHIIANRLVCYLRTCNGDMDLQPVDFLELEEFNNESVIELLNDNRAFMFDEKIIRGFFDDPRSFRYDSSTKGQEDNLSCRSSSAVAVVRRQLTVGDETHATHQKSGDYETFIFEHDKWYVIFEKTWTSGGRNYSYRQKDEIPIFDTKADIPELRAGEKDTYIQHPGRIPRHYKSSMGRWTKVKANGALGKWRLIRRDAKKGKVVELAAPKLIARKFHRFNHAYLDQYKIAKSWRAWEKHVEAFDMNDRKWTQNYNRWIQQVLERNHFEYEKRVFRHCWTKEEIKALRGHFNDLIMEHGLIQAYMCPEWNAAIDKVNTAMPEDYRKEYGLRNENSVTSFAERDVFANDTLRLGIHEWREIGKKLSELQRDHPGLTIPNEFIYPKQIAIPIDDVQSKEAGGGHRGLTRCEPMHNPRRQKRQPKILVTFHEGRILITDNFDGKLLKKFDFAYHGEAEYGAKAQVQSQDRKHRGHLRTQNEDESPAENEIEDKNEDQDDDESEWETLCEDGGENDLNDDGDEDEEPPRKRQKGGD